MFILKSIGGLAATLLALAAHAAPITFDVPVTTGPLQAPGVWYTDRYAPAGFQTDVFGGDNRLKHSISAADSGSSRPPSFVAPFYNTQGRKFDAPVATTAMQIDLYLDSAWNDTSRRYAGLWGTAFNVGNVISYYPIIEFGMGEFRVWNGASFVSSGQALAGLLDTWVNLGITLTGGNWEYDINGFVVATLAANSSTYIGNVILQGHNTTAGVNYDIHWDNLNFGTRTGTVPVPGTLLLTGLALSLLAVVGRRRKLAA